MSDFELVSCTLSDGSTSTCYQVTVGTDPAEWGPGCPATVDDVGGVGFYDPDGVAVLYALDADLWTQMEADGFDIVDDDGTVHVVTPTGPPGRPPPPPGSMESACLDAELVESIEITYLSPASPALAASTTQVELPTLEYSGISLDGLPFAPPPPATVNGSVAALPALDPCGGHPQPDGPFHWHLTPHEANNVLAANDIRSDVRCSAISQSSSTIIGYAADGFAIYGAQDADGSTPSGLDSCSGHTVDARYHYHVSSTEAPNNLTCLSGLIPDDWATYN